MGAGLELTDTARKSSIRVDWIGKPRSIFIRNPLITNPCISRAPTSHLELDKSRFLIAFRSAISNVKIRFRSFTFRSLAPLWGEIRIFRYAGWIRLRILHRLSRTDFYLELKSLFGASWNSANPPPQELLSVTAFILRDHHVLEIFTKKRSQTVLEHFRVSYSPKDVEYDPWVLDSGIFMLRLVPQLHLSSEMDHFSRGSFKNHAKSSLKALSERRFVNVLVQNFQISLMKSKYRFLRAQRELCAQIEFSMKLFFHFKWQDE